MKAEGKICGGKRYSCPYVMEASEDMRAMCKDILHRFKEIDYGHKRRELQRANERKQHEEE